MAGIWKIGLTGGIASGKSVAGNILRDLGAPVIDCDKLAREVIEPGRPANELLCRAFGAEYFDSKGRLDRVKLARLIFDDEYKRQQLEAIIHPAVQQAVEEQLAALERSGALAAIIDIPLLFEVGWQNIVDEVWLVWVPPVIQRQRLSERDGFNETEINGRLKAQDSLDDKRQLVDVVIDNSGSFDSTKNQLTIAWRAIMKKISDGKNI